MATKTLLKTLRCPTCGGTLKAENETDMITCVYCGNTIVPVTTASPEAQTQFTPDATLKVEGIKTSSSALAYIEQFFEEYDWDAFTYAQALSVSKIDRLVSSLKDSSADDKNTWFAFFQSVYVPYVHKISGCKKVFFSVLDEYKKNDLDSYSKFDAYKRVVSSVMNAKSAVVAKLEKAAAYAEKYGASSDEMSKLRSNIEEIKAQTPPPVFDSIEEIPAIKAFLDEKNADIARDLAEKGINADAEYDKAKKLVAENRYTEALKTLVSLNGYADSASLIEKIDRYYLIDDILEIEGVLYYFSNSAETPNTYNLHPTVNGKIAEKPLIKDIGKIITNFADVLYFLDSANKLKSHNFSTGAESVISKKNIQRNWFHVYSRRVYMLTETDEYGSEKNELVELDTQTGAIKTVLKNVIKILSASDNKIVFTAYKATENNSGKNKAYTFILNLDTYAATAIPGVNIKVEGFVNDSVVYTLAAPNKANRNLFVKSLRSDAPALLIEKNIFSFCDIIAGKLFYYIGNDRNHTLINTELNGTGRKEWPLFISKVLFEQAGWVYFIRKAGYNSVLCKSQLDGSKFTIIASDISSFISIKNGYLYYLNNSSSLMKVRMDGSNLQELCSDVETVLTVKENRIVFVSIDDRIMSGEFGQTVTVIKSIYAVDFNGSGKIKLAYNIKTAKKYDNDTVYYIISEKSNQAESPFDNTQENTLYRVDVESYKTDRLLRLEVQKQKSESTSPAVVLLVFAVVSLVLAIMFFVAGIAVGGVIALIASVAMFAVGGYMAKNQKENALHM